MGFEIWGFEFRVWVLGVMNKVAGCIGFRNTDLWFRGLFSGFQSLMCRGHQLSRRENAMKQIRRSPVWSPGFGGGF